MSRLPGYNLLEPCNVAFHAVCLGAALQKNQLLAEFNPKGSFRQVAKNREMISYALSKDVRKFLFCKPNTHDPVVIRRWAVDQLAILLWALGVIDQKPAVEVAFDEEALCARIPFSGNLVKFIENATLRSIEELYPLEVALDVYGYRATLLTDDYDFDGNLKDRTLKKAQELFDAGYLVSAPTTDDLVVHGQCMEDLDLFEVEQTQELSQRRTYALFYVFGKMRRC